MRCSSEFTTGKNLPIRSAEFRGIRVRCQLEAVHRWSILGREITWDDPIEAADLPSIRAEIRRRVAAKYP